MDHDHHHHHADLRAGARHYGALKAAFAVNLAMFAIEVGVAIWAHSLALLSEGVHVLTDAVGVGMALAAIGLGNRMPREGTRTFGVYRLEILAALANAVLLFGAVAYVLVETVDRLRTPAPVRSAPVIVVGLLGLAANGAGFLLVRAGARESLAVEGAAVDMLADTIGSAGVVVSGVLVAAFGWTRVDPIVGALIALWIIPRAWSLASSSVRILMQAAPPHLDIGAVERDLASLDRVIGVHDLHVWTLTSDMEVASAHLVVGSLDDVHRVLDAARVLLHDRYDIAHATLQVEPADHTGCEELNW
ncbi:MAG: cation diffusion facilitator family transporter [Acidimicrobiia bacterium]